MHFSIQNFKFSIWVLIFSISNIFSLTISDPRISEAGLLCGSGRPPPNTTNIPTFVQEMRGLSGMVTTNNNGWGTYHVSNSVPPIYGLAQCHHDLSHTDCLLCYAASRTRLPRCLPATSARIYLDGCFLRYDNYSFFDQAVDPVRDTVNCTSNLESEKDEGSLLEFRNSVRVVVENITEIAGGGGGGGYGVVEFRGVFGLGQCWKTLSREGCRECLEKAGREVVEKCMPSREGRGLNAGCYLRYSTQKFYNDAATQTRNNNISGASDAGTKVAIALSAVAFFMFLLFAAYAAYVRLSKLNEERSLGQISGSFNSLSKGSMSFKYETLEKATDYFNISRKIGQGGAGSVFKGTLPSGEVIAVKRLVFNTKQWVDEFFNEVNLISRIQHKNLVKLLGCSIEGPESLLVYEYVQNRSLDQFLFDKERVQVLNWKQRFEIILGTAEGLAYLHGGSDVRIIHRDIKSSNVLLDENLAPKIADFGLARCFGTHQSHLSTGIAGTLGYMAPEYIVRGQLTEKADIYSFGVLVLEIVSGRKNIAFIEDSSSLLQTVWKLYQSGNVVESVDPCLKDNFPAKEASIVIQIGLLCSQASAALRPSMDEVVRMLILEDSELPIPKQPPFLNGRALHSTSSSGSYGLNSIISSALTKMETSYTSTTYSSTATVPNSSGEPSRSE